MLWIRKQLVRGLRNQSLRNLSILIKSQNDLANLGVKKIVSNILQTQFNLKSRQ